MFVWNKSGECSLTTPPEVVKTDDRYIPIYISTITGISFKDLQLFFHDVLFVENLIDILDFLSRKYPSTFQKYFTA